MKKVIDEEMAILKKKIGTWEIADLPEGRKSIGCKWVFVKQRAEEGKLIKYKAWLVAQDFHRNPEFTLAMMELLHWSCGLKPYVPF